MKSTKKLAKLLAGMLNSTDISDTIVMVAVFELIENCTLTLMEDTIDAVIIDLNGYFVRIECGCEAGVYKGKPEEFFSIVPSTVNTGSEVLMYLKVFRDKLK